MQVFLQLHRTSECMAFEDERDALAFAEESYEVQRADLFGRHGRKAKLYETGDGRRYAGTMEWINVNIDNK